MVLGLVLVVLGLVLVVLGLVLVVLELCQELEDSILQREVKKKCLHKISRRILKHHGVSKPVFFFKGLTPAQAKAAKYGNISLW